MTLTHSIVDINDYMLNLLITNQDDLGLKDVWYGKQNLIPDFPAATVESGKKNRSLSKPASTHKYDVDFTEIITLYQSEVTTSIMKDRDMDVLSEKVEDLINADRFLGTDGLNGLVIFGHVLSNEPVVVRGSVFYRARRLTWGGDSREVF